MFRRYGLTISYLSLMIVMGGRTAIFVSQFDHFTIFQLAGANVTLLGVLFALALMAAVAASSRARGRANKNSLEWTRAGRTRTVAVIADGWFNIAEAYMLSIGLALFEDFSIAPRIFFYVTTGMIGLIPTFLTMYLAELSGSLERREDAVAKRTSINVNIRKEVVRSTIMDDHWTTIFDHCSSSDVIRRTMIEQWTGVGKQQAVNIINYGKSMGLVDERGRGVYILNQGNWEEASK